jgi:antitoxin component YwqK of YwqJK toxin-antitoxin module
MLILVLVGCEESTQEIRQPIVNVENDVEIPELLVSSTDSGIIKKQNGDTFFNGKPFSGYLIERYPNDTIAIKKGYYEGKQNGIMTAFYENGNTRYIRPYFNGEKHGTHVGFHRNGVKAFEYHFVKGFSEGNHKEWFDNGQPATNLNYVNGKEFGKQQAWRPDGKVRSNYIVRENGRRYGLMGIKRCTKLDGVTQTVDPYKGKEQ